MIWPLGSAIKANVEKLWREHFVIEDDLMEIQATCVTPEEVLIASVSNLQRELRVYKRKIRNRIVVEEEIAGYSSWNFFWIKNCVKERERKDIHANKGE